MTIMPVLIGFCYELKKKNSLFREDNNTSDGEIKGNAASRRAISSYAMKVSAFVHILCSLQGTHYNDVSENGLIICFAFSDFLLDRPILIF